MVLEVAIHVRRAQGGRRRITVYHQQAYSEKINFVGPLTSKGQGNEAGAENGPRGPLLSVPIEKYGSWFPPVRQDPQVGIERMQLVGGSRATS